MSYTVFAKDIFVEILESLPPSTVEDPTEYNEGIVTSVSQFIALLSEIITSSKEIYSIPDTSVLIPVEQFPRDLAWKINNGQETITDTSKKQLTIVTYTAKEMPAQVSAHSPYDTRGIRNIKPRLIDSYPDPKYEGYSVIRIGKNIEATIELMVWGLEDKGIRDRSAMLRNIIRDNIWYLKHKGLKDIVWLGATENDKVDKQNIVQYKKEVYKIVFTELQELREKNIEQVLLSMGIAN